MIKTLVSLNTSLDQFLLMNHRHNDNCGSLNMDMLLPILLNPLAQDFDEYNSISRGEVVLKKLSYPNSCLATLCSGFGLLPPLLS